jgi:hypothetical protein
MIPFKDDGDAGSGEACTDDVSVGGCPAIVPRRPCSQLPPEGGTPSRRSGAQWVAMTPDSQVEAGKLVHQAVRELLAAFPMPGAGNPSRGSEGSAACN